MSLGSDWESGVRVGSGVARLKGRRLFRKGRQPCAQHCQPLWFLDCGKGDMGLWKDSPPVLLDVRGQGQGAEECRVLARSQGQ